MEYDERTWSEWKIDLHLPLNIKYPKNCVYFFLHMQNAKIIIIMKREVNALFFCSVFLSMLLNRRHLCRIKSIKWALFSALFEFVFYRSNVDFFSRLLKKNREMKFLSLKIRIVCTRCGVFFSSLFISLAALQFIPNNNKCARMHRFFFGYCNKKSNFAVLFSSIQIKTFQYFTIALFLPSSFSLFYNSTFV